VANTLCLAPDNLLAPPCEQIPVNLINIVLAGTYFLREGLVLEVIAINGNYAEDNSNQFSLDINELAQLINDYIS